MRPVPFEIPPDWNCEVIGAVYEADDRADRANLSEDMLEIVLPNGILISAGWYPDADPDGQYIVTVTKGLNHVIDPFATASAFEAVEAVRDRVDDFRWRSAIVSQNFNASADINVVAIA